ncbi:AEC family transporter [Nostoc sp.]|uniref:AEC family transporter n=2 Tax=Nostoc sp. TaxID=1180 RepID=UPI002FFA6544
MTTVLLALGLIAWLGSILCYILKDLDVGAGRKMIGVLVLNIFLPALVFRVIYTSEMGSEFYQIPLTILLSTVACLGVAILVFRAFKLQPQEKGALILASAFGNVTYLGLPVLQGLFPTLALQVAKVAILCEVTTTPLNLSLGMTLGARFKEVMRDQKPKETEADLAIGAFPLLTPLQTCVKIVRQTVQEMVKLPALWAVAIALVWKLSGLPVPAFLLQATQILGNTVTGLMMLSLGMGLRYRRIYQPLPLLIAGGIKLLISPLVVFGIATLIGIQSPYLEAIVLEGAMPTQLLTFIIADRIGLNSERLALCILINTAASFLTIPLMKTLLFGGRAISF